MSPPDTREERAGVATSSTALALERWARSRSGSPALARAIALAAEAEAEGHACVHLGAHADLDLTAIRAHPWVGTGDRLSACVLDAQDDFFLWRNWRHEQQIAAGVRARVAATTAMDPRLWAHDLDLLYAGMDPSHAAGQRAAVSAAIGKRVFVLSGGPGTGKTTTVLRLLLMLQRQAARNGERSQQIALAAPTGKAAQRLSQSLREGAQALRPQLAAADAAADAASHSWLAALGTLPDSAQTLHRLLGFAPQSDRFHFDGEHPLPADIVVVDEASMVDLALMRALIDALAAHTTLILLGDPDQLVSVSAGSVLADWVNAAQADPAGLGAHSAHLTHVWRAEQGLAQVYAAVRSGDAARLQQLLATADDVRLQPIDDGAALTRQLQQWVARPEWANLHALAQSAEPEPALLALRQLQLLTALRGGRYGAEQVNAQIDEHWRHAWGDAQWYPGRPVLIRHNDYGRRLFNGDVGLALGLGAELRVYFETVDGDGRASVRALSPRELPEYDLAYALTVHQSQGSEYGHVAVLLPPDAQNRILSRQLLYTAVSRARRSVELWCSVSSLHVALSRLSLRAGGLRARLGAPNMHTGTL